MSVSRLAFALAIVGLTQTACQTGQRLPTPPAHLESLTKTTLKLQEIPAPAVPVDVAIYEFPDLTGQAKPNENFAEYSRAVTQGGANILVDVLKSAGNGHWFRVVERAGLKNLVQERTLIENTQRAYSPKSGNLPPVRFAGLILEGGIVGYDSNERTGGGTWESAAISPTVPTSSPSPCAPSACRTARCWSRPQPPSRSTPT